MIDSFSVASVTASSGTGLSGSAEAVPEDAGSEETVSAVAPAKVQLWVRAVLITDSSEFSMAATPKAIAIRIDLK